MTKSKTTDPEPGSPARIAEAYELLKTGAPMDVKVGGQWAVVTPHPAALMFPVVSREEFGALVADVAEHGFKQFPHLRDPGATTPSTWTYGGDLEVVEGRHRVAVAYALGISISVNKFVGSDEDARVLVVSSNLHRRHLTKAQEALIVCETYLPVAKKRADDRLRKGASKGGKGRLSGGEASEEKPSLKATEEASQMSGGLVSRASIERIQIVTREHTPKTYERVWTGQVTTVTGAHKEAQAELDDEPDEEPLVAPPTEAAVKKYSDGIEGQLIAARDLLATVVERRTEGEIADMPLGAQHALLDQILASVRAYTDLLADEPV